MVKPFSEWFLYKILIDLSIHTKPADKSFIKINTCGHK